ncbi:MAG: hypothetical protein KIT50_10690 [Bacteroidetes bacterium]|nr:hypothetical protein [Bacteroidota bacterium]
MLSRHRCVVTMVVAVVLLAGSARTLAQRVADHKVTVHAKLSHNKVAAGSAFYAMLVVEVHDGWHINSATPSDENQIETVVNLGAIEGIRVEEVRYPQGILREFGFSDVPLDVYEGSVNILVKLHASETTKPGARTLPLLLAYQACNDNICLAPTSIVIDVPLEVAASGDDDVPVNQDFFKSSQDENHR